MTAFRAQVYKRFPLLFDSPSFRWMWLATLISGIGNWLGILALNIYVFDLTKSVTAIAGLMVAESVPALVLSPIAGVVVDRFRRRHVMIAAHLGAGLLWGLLPFTTELWQIYVLALLARVTTSFYQPAERSLVPDLVAKDQVLNANATLSIVSTSTIVIGPAIAGVLVATSGPAIALWIDAISYFVAIFCILRIRGELPRTKAANEANTSWKHDTVAGLRFAAGHPALRLLLITTFVAAFAGAGLLTVELVYIKEFLGGGDQGYGFYYSVAGVGAVIASSIAGLLVRRFTLAVAYVASVLVTGLMFFPYANIPILWFVIIVAGLHTVPWVLAMIYVDTMIQQWVDPSMRGRVFALVQAERSAGQVLLAAILAPLVDLWGPVPVMNLSGVIYTMVGIYAVSRVGLLRHAEQLRQRALAAEADSR